MIEKDPMVIRFKGYDDSTTAFKYFHFEKIEIP